MLSCWDIHPHGRPTFTTLKDSLENILLSSEEYLELDIDGEDADTKNTVNKTEYADMEEDSAPQSL